LLILARSKNCECLRQLVVSSPKNVHGTPGEGWSHATIDRMMGTVGAALRKCVAWRILDHAPSTPKYRATTPEPRRLTRQQFEKLCKELPEHLELGARFATLTMLRMRAAADLGSS
jgi:hypothetical protein